MANYRGVDASVTYDGVALTEARGWTLRSAVDTLDTTVMGTSSYKTFRAGLVEWDGTVDVNLDLADAKQLLMFQKLTGASPASTATAAELIAATGKKFSGTIVVTQFNVTSQVGSLITGTLTFKGSGTLTVAWA